MNPNQPWEWGRLWRGSPSRPSSRLDSCRASAWGGEGGWEWGRKKNHRAAGQRDAEKEANVMSCLLVAPRLEYHLLLAPNGTRSGRRRQRSCKTPVIDNLNP